MDVKWLKAVLTLALIGAFALATNHCRLEVLKGLEFLVCCAHDVANGDGHAEPHQDDDCETDGCASLEEGLYKSEDGHIAQVAPLVVEVEIEAADEALLSQPAPLALFSTFAPPELPASWHFLLRVASPPRAPSLAS